MGKIRPWLARYSWEFVTAQNALLCQAKGALHKATSDGHDQTQRLWKDQHEKLMRLEEAGRYVANAIGWRLSASTTATPSPASSVT